MRRLTLATSFALLVCAAVCVAHVSAHKFYTSLARVEYNPGEKSVEITLRVFADDLELALKRRAGRAVSLERTKDAERLVLEYLRDTFEIKNRDGQSKTLKWVGMELRAGVAWLYVEAEMPEGLAGARLRDQVLFELFPKQVNTVSVSYPGASGDLVFTRGDGERAVPPPAR
ncbi:MAG TPA: DUF6702 family protein [Pyrinomonadaceae bacterium]|jgi:hypothetical protein